MSPAWLHNEQRRLGWSIGMSELDCIAPASIDVSGRGSRSEGAGLHPLNGLAIEPQVPSNVQMTVDDDINFKREALRIEIEDGANPALSPIGCVIVMDGSIIAAERNHVAEHHDAVAHAEIEAIRKTGHQFENDELRGATLYTTLPCGMCTVASIWSKVRQIVYGVGRDDVHQMYFEARHINTLEFFAKAYRDDLTIHGGVLREEWSKLYYRPWDKVPLDKQGNK